MSQTIEIDGVAIPAEVLAFARQQVEAYLPAVLGLVHEVLPLARVEVSPGDFPFLEHMLAHDDERLSDYAAAMQAGAPWPE